MLTIEEVRARGVSLPSNDDYAQDVIDEAEAWLASRIGPLDGRRTETFLEPDGDAILRLRRPTRAVTVTDGGDAATVTLSNDIYVTSEATWTGPVLVTYTPVDDVLVRGTLMDLLRLGVTETGYESETMGAYSYTKPVASAKTTRWSLVRNLLPRATFDAIPVRSGFDRPFPSLIVGSDSVA